MLAVGRASGGDAGADFADRLVDQTDRVDAMAALVTLGRLQFTACVLQRGRRIGHVRLRGERPGGGQDNGGYAPELFVDVPSWQIL